MRKCWNEKNLNEFKKRKKTLKTKPSEKCFFSGWAKSVEENEKWFQTKKTKFQQKTTFWGFHRQTNKTKNEVFSDHSRFQQEPLFLSTIPNEWVKKILLIEKHYLKKQTLSFEVLDQNVNWGHFVLQKSCIERHFSILEMQNQCFCMYNTWLFDFNWRILYFR